MELFEQIRREYEEGAGAIRPVAKKLGIHRRIVRQALVSSVPPERRRPGAGTAWPVRQFIDEIEGDLHVRRKQRHTAHGIYVRIRISQRPAPPKATVQCGVSSYKPPTPP